MEYSWTISLTFVSLFCLCVTSPIVNLKDNSGDKKAQINSLKSQVQKLQLLLENMDTGNDDATIPSTQETTKTYTDVIAQLPKSQQNNHVSNEGPSGEQQEATDIINSLTKEDINVLTNLRDALQEMQRSRGTETMDQQQYTDDDRRKPYDKTLADLFDFYRTHPNGGNYRDLPENDRDAYERYSDSQRSFVPRGGHSYRDRGDTALSGRYSDSQRSPIHRRPAYRDRADKALSRVEFNGNSRGHLYNFVDEDTTTETKQLKLKKIEKTLLDGLQAGVKEGISLEDLIDDLQKVKTHGEDKKKRTLIENEENQLKALREKLQQSSPK